MRTTGKLPGFDGLRAVAAGSVLVYHLEFFAPVGGRSGALHALFQQLRAGVWIFFVLSGFLLYRGWARAHLADGMAPALGEYFRNRVLRIFPAYWLALVWFTWKGRTLLSADLGLGPVVRQFSLTQIYSPADVVARIGLPRGLPHAWSLAVELSFYLALPGYAWLVGRAGRRLGARRAEWAGVATLVALWIVWTTTTSGDAIRQQWLPNFAMAFGAGIALAVVGADPLMTERVLPALRRAGAWPWVLAAALVVVRASLTIAAENGFVSQLLYTAIALAIVVPVAVGVPGDLSVRLLDAAPMRVLGTWSYGIFLWHYLLIRSVQADWLDGTTSLLRLAAAVVPITLAVAAASWYLLERPILGAAPAGGRMRFALALAVVGGGALAWRVFYVLAERGRLVLNGDARYYQLQANAVAKGLGFVIPENLRDFSHMVQSAGHPPAYILYLAGFSRVGLDSETAHRLASCLLGAATVVVIGVVARRIALAGAHDAPLRATADRVGIVAAVLAAGYANLWINDEMLMSESMAALATAIVLLGVYRFIDSPSRRTALELGAAVGFAALSRAELLVLAGVLVVPLVALRNRAIPLRRRVGWAGSAVAVVVLLVAPWIGYNLTRFNRPVLMSNGLGGVTLHGNCDATYHGALLGYWYAYCNPTVSADLRGDESDHEARWREAGTAYMRDHLDRLPVVVLARVGRMWEVYRVDQNTSLNAAFEGRGTGPSTVANRQYYLLLAAGLAGLVVLRRRRVPIWPFLVIAGLVTFTAATSFGITRYRIPVDVALPILAAVGGVAVLRALADRRALSADTVPLRTA